MEGYYFGSYFFAPKGKYESCGMFSRSHILASSICLFTVLLLFVILRRRLSGSGRKNLCRVLAPTVTLLEATQIGYCIHYGYLDPDSCIPLSYCGLFIFALWGVGFGKGFFWDCSRAYLAFGAPIAGLAFLIFPATSLSGYPVWHFLSLYSLFFHSSMLLLGLLALDDIRLTKRLYFAYSSFVLLFSLIALILNFLLGSNFMGLREPYNIPIHALNAAYGASHILYTLLVLAGYLLMPPVTDLIRGKRKK